MESKNALGYIPVLLLGLLCRSRTHTAKTYTQLFRTQSGRFNRHQWPAVAEHLHQVVAVVLTQSFAPAPAATENYLQKSIAFYNSFTQVGLANTGNQEEMSFNKSYHLPVIHSVSNSIPGILKSIKK